MLTDTPMGYIMRSWNRYPVGVWEGAVRTEDERRDLMNRLKRIEGQVRGLQRMLEEGAYCPEILTQASAANSALNSFCRVLLTSHLRTCVSEDIRAGREDTVDELMVVLQKLMK